MWTGLRLWLWAEITMTTLPKFLPLFCLIRRGPSWWQADLRTAKTCPPLSDCVELQRRSCILTEEPCSLQTQRGLQLSVRSRTLIHGWCVSEHDRELLYSNFVLRCILMCMFVVIKLWHVYTVCKVISDGSSLSSWISQAWFYQFSKYCTATLEIWSLYSTALSLNCRFHFTNSP